MQEFKDRLKHARKNAKLTQVELAKAVKTSQGSISDLESGRNKISNNIFQLAQALGVNPHWLATGQGEMTDKPSKEQLQTKIDRLQGKVSGVEQAPPIKILPIVNEVQAGQFTEIADNVFDEYAPAHHKDGSYWLRVRGDSMTPDFVQGDLILVGKDRTATTGNYVIALLDDDPQATFKKYRECFDNGERYHELIALNAFYPPIDSRTKPFTVIGVVLEHKRVLV